ncbi:DUF1822 family protein [Pleurocapsa sp. PCC 7319]|uniref:DUF1822 family protein n=1 Tax=Pleurocapsa sp. PCC 7319 TaxID=118161 RepID=UPI000344F324|nr:DUF1822 family protein [Pleurocapsa sp. PCC 7319]
MNLDVDTALKMVDKAVNQHLGRGLNPPEEAVIRGTWQKIGYKEMENTTEFSRNYLMRDVAPKLWKLLSHVFGKPVNKHNFRSVLENLPVNQEYIEVRKNQIITDRLAPNPNNTETYLSELWQEIAEGSFIGRETELNTLKQWILEDRLQLISVLGINGIGKTSLCQQFTRLYGDQFDCVVWQSLASHLAITELISQLNRKVAYLLSKERDCHGQQLEHLLAVMSEKRCLIVLDGLETLLQKGTTNREYLSEYVNYQQFFYKIATLSHQSCVLVTSVENPKNNLALETATSLVRSLLLSGLTIEDAGLFLGISITDEPNWNHLIEKYQGHPLALKIIQKTIKDIFNDNVNEFLAQKIFIFGEIEDMLAHTLGRLSSIELEILYCLAVETKPLSINQIRNNINLTIDKADLLNSLVSLERRGLLETLQIKEQSLFTLGAMIHAYLSKKLIERATSTSFSYSSERNFTSKEDFIDLSVPANTQQANLSKWQQGDFETDWQSIEKLLLNTQKLSERLRGTYYLQPDMSIKRCKAIKLGSESVVLLVEIKPDSQGYLSIRVQVYPPPAKSTLPANLKLSLINDSGDFLREVISRREDNFIQLPLIRGKAPEKFTIGLAMNDLFIQENFMM